MKRVEIKMELLRDIVSGLYHTGGFKTVEELIDHLTECSSASYVLHVEDDQVIDVPHEVNRLTMKEVEKMLTASESKAKVIGMDVSDPKNDSVQIIEKFSAKRTSERHSIGATNIVTGTQTPFGKVFDDVRGVNVDAVFFDETWAPYKYNDRPGGFVPISITRDDTLTVTKGCCTGCGCIKDPCDSQMVDLQSGYLMYKCDECEAKCDGSEKPKGDND